MMKEDQMHEARNTREHPGMLQTSGAFVGRGTFESAGGPAHSRTLARYCSSFELRHSFVIRAYSFVISLFLLLTTTLSAHHGRDFILIQDSAIPAPFTGVAIAGYEWTSDGDTNESSTEPGFFMGIAPALAFGLSAGFSDEGDGWNYTGVTPQFVVSILPATGPLNFRVGLWTGYEFAEEQADSGHSGATSHSHNSGSGPDAGPVAPHGHGAAGSGGHDHGSHGGIHRHGESGWYNRVIMEADITHHTRVILNLISFVSGNGGGPGFGYAAGVRHEFNHDLSLGIETIGDFEERQSSHQVLFTTMIGLPSHFSLRLGVGGGLTRAAPDFTLHSSVLWRF
ncbi:MAG: hypothetical protein NTV80_23265 [Verrucomicrobia bacterium]|nr:hypothetical protein [Verrucomicrobiota bacterium]